MVPRKVKFDGDCINSDGDGFYWNGRVYLSEEFFKNNNLSIILPNDHLFQGYYVWNSLGELKSDHEKLKWDQGMNTISVNSLKVLINGEKIDGAARFGTKGQILINYAKISRWLNEKNWTKPVFVIDTTEGNQFGGEFIEGELWVNSEALIIQPQVSSYQWDEATWSLKIYYIPD